MSILCKRSAGIKFYGEHLRNIVGTGGKAENRPVGYCLSGVCRNGLLGNPLLVLSLFDPRWQLDGNWFARNCLCGITESGVAGIGLPAFVCVGFVIAVSRKTVCQELSLRPGTNCDFPRPHAMFQKLICQELSL